MLTVLEMNPEGYGSKIFEGNTLEELLKDITEYYEDDLEFLETILEQAKEVYRKEVDEYVYCDGCGLVAHDDELIRAEIEGILAGNSLDIHSERE